MFTAARALHLDRRHPMGGAPADIAAPSVRSGGPRREQADSARELDEGLRSLGRREAVCRRLLGRLAGEFLRRRAHHALGFARLGDYARERLGLSAREVQSVARAVAAMERLPMIARAFERGEISWTQARVLSAVATGETEASWLALARGKTGRALEAVARGATDTAPSGARAILDDCRAERGVLDGEPAVRFRLRCPRRVRVLWRNAVELARRMAGEQLPVWQAAEAIAAEGMSAAEVAPPRSACTGDDGAEGRDWLGASNARNGSGGDGAALARAAEAKSAMRGCCANGTAACDHRAERPAPLGVDRSVAAMAIPEDVTYLAADPASLDAWALDAALRHVVRATQAIDWQTGRLLRPLFDRRLYTLLGFSSVAQYVDERLAISPRKASALVAVERKAARVPAFADAYRQGQLSWFQALTILPVLDGGEATAWVARTREVTVRRLADEVEWALNARDMVAPCTPIAPPPAGASLVAPALQMCARGASDEPGNEPVDAEISFVGPASVVGLMRSVAAAFASPLAPHWKGLEALLQHVKREWERQPRHPDPVFARDGWRCAVPACSSRKNLHDHHVRFRSRGGGNARANRVTVCAWHHLRGIHAGRVRAWGTAPQAVHWQIGVRADGPPLLELLGDRYVMPLDGSLGAMTDGGT